MNIFFWVLQILLAVHTAIGAVWKLSNPEQTVPSLKAIAHPVWLGLSAVELVCSVALVLPFFVEPLAVSAPIAASFIVVEMLFFCAVHLASDDNENGPMYYWLGVAAFSALIAVGRFMVAPL